MNIKQYIGAKIANEYEKLQSLEAEYLHNSENGVYDSHPKLKEEMEEKVLNQRIWYGLIKHAPTF